MICTQLSAGDVWNVEMELTPLKWHDCCRFVEKKVFHPLPKYLWVFNIHSITDVSLLTYFSVCIQVRHTRLPQRSCGHPTPHTHIETVCPIVCTGEQIQITHISSPAPTHPNTYTGSFLALALFHSLKHTHMLSKAARWNHSVGCWPFTFWRLDFSLFLLLHRPPSPLSPHPTYPLTSSLSLSPLRPNLFFPSVSAAHFYFFFYKQHRTKTDCVCWLHSEVGFLWTIFSPKIQWKVKRCVIVMLGKEIPQSSWAITRKLTFSPAAFFLNQIRGRREEGEMLSPPSLWVGCAVNIDFRLKAITIMKQKKPYSLCQNVLGFGVQFIE